jgi:predicted kinase
MQQHKSPATNNPHIAGAVTLTIVQGESGSGKSTWAREYIDQHRERKIVRINRDDIRSMLHSSDTSLEKDVAAVEELQIRHFLSNGYSVLLDNTHLSLSSVSRLQNIAANMKVSSYIHRMETSLEDCIQHDEGRIGKSHVGRAVICRQFLKSGRLQLDPNKKIVLVDVDGTLANSTGIRSPYDEDAVGKDRVYPLIAAWVRELAKDHTILIVSGRHSTCGDATIAWLNFYQIPFDHIFMRHGWDSRHDYIAKSEILNELLGLVSKEQILMAIDDRYQVVEKAWRANGIKCIPVRGTPHHSLTCPNLGVDSKKTCEHCGAIGNF